MAKVQNTDNVKCWQGCGTINRNPHSLLVRMQNSTYSLGGSQKTKHTLTICPLNALSLLVSGIDQGS